MALSSEQRISISKKIIEIPKQNANADFTKAQLETSKIVFEKEDEGNKSLIDDITALVNIYQSELNRYDGNGRTTLTEQDFLNSVNKVSFNSFFPSNAAFPLPSIPDGIWKQFVAFSGNKAIGKNYNETFTSVVAEQSLIDTINTQLAIIEGFPDVQRSTGQECILGDQGPPIVADDIVPNFTIQNAHLAAETGVQVWEDFMIATQGLVPTAGQDPDAGRIIENDASRQNVTDSLPAINTWQALQDFDTSQSTNPCAVFNGIDVSTLNPTKYRIAELQPLKDQIATRQGFIATRISQIVGHLGSITQDFNTGEITNTVGFYGDRFRFIDMRLNLIGGSLSLFKSLEKGQIAQDELKQANANALVAYNSILTVTAFRAPAAGTKVIHVLDASGFSVGNSVFVISNNHAEISATINDIQDNRVTLSVTIPNNYRQDEGARLYKVL